MSSTSETRVRAPIHPPTCPPTPLMKKFKNKHEKNSESNKVVLLLNNRKCSHKGISSFLKFKFGFDSDGHG
ncbi:Uncharacterized protein APZ42_031994 [Daphnia magna]|uniref:Uncharacterized protein n=1 Tax=Daphnia magna TaxID=35525 RepID=A0A164MFS5_9CRUS|nr:Uncharacterized protein APZ42_031994 [Daphnia magna]